MPARDAALPPSSGAHLLRLGRPCPRRCRGSTSSRVDADTSVPPRRCRRRAARNTCRAERVTTSRGRAALAGDLLPYPEGGGRARARDGRAGRCRPVIRPVRPGPGARHLLLPAFPTLAGGSARPGTRTPLPCTGRACGALRMLAATSPTCCLSIPSTTNLVGDSTRSVIPSGRGPPGTGWLKAERELPGPGPSPATPVTRPRRSPASCGYPSVTARHHVWRSASGDKARAAP